MQVMYEYKVVFDRDPNGFTAALNAAGEEGWQIKNCDWNSGFWAVLERSRSSGELYQETLQVAVDLDDIEAQRNRAVTMRKIVQVEQYMAAIDYITTHNPAAKGDRSWAKGALDNLIGSIGEECWSTGTAGFWVSATEDEPGRMDIDIHVDPSVGSRDYTYMKWLTEELE